MTTTDPNVQLALTIAKSVLLVLLSGFLIGAGDYQIHRDLANAELLGVIAVASIAVVQLGGAGAVAQIAKLRTPPVTLPVALDPAVRNSNRAQLATITSIGYPADDHGMLSVHAEDFQALVRIAKDAT